MSQLIDIHEEGEHVFTLADTGALQAFRVAHDGNLERVAPTQALAEEGKR